MISLEEKKENNIPPLYVLHDTSLWKKTFRRNHISKFEYHKQVWFIILKIVETH